MAWADLAAAARLLTRLPLPAAPNAPRADAAWAWPLAGLAVALAAGFVGMVAVTLGLAPVLAAGLTLATQVIVTGAMHEDGLADSADGLWGGWTPARRLEIMKDSSIGSYGTIALILSLGLRWSALTMLISGGYLWAPLIAAAMASRTPMAALMATLPNARGSGLASSIGRPSTRAAWTGAGFAALACLILTGWGVVLLAFVAGATTMAVGALAKARIGGVTGDICGAAQQIAEIAALAVLSVILL